MYLSDEALETLTSSNDLTTGALAAEVLRLRRAIATHAAKRGHELCWLDDVDLWRAAGIPGIYPHDTLPVREEFLVQCRRYYEARIRGTAYEEPPTTHPVTNR